jgi:hypothetical protein
MTDEAWKAELDKIFDDFQQVDKPNGTRVPPYGSLAAFVDLYGANPEASDRLTMRFNANRPDPNYASIIATHAPIGSQLESKAVAMWQKAIQSMLERPEYAGGSGRAMTWIVSSALAAPEGSLLEEAAINMWKFGIEKAEQGLVQFKLARHMLQTAFSSHPARKNLATAAQEIIARNDQQIRLLKASAEQLRL